MKQNLITDVIQGMLPYLNNAQTERLQEVLQHTPVSYTHLLMKYRNKSFWEGHKTITFDTLTDRHQYLSLIHIYAMAEIHSHISDEMFRKKQERSKDYER